MENKEIKVVLSEGSKNYIIFSRVLSLAKDVFDTYKTTAGSEKLFAYISILEQMDIFKDTKILVESFRSALNGKHRSILGDMAWFNVPKYLSYNDSNTERIKEKLNKIKEIYNDVTAAEEYKQLNDMYKKIYNSCASQEINNITKENVGEVVTEAINEVVEELRPTFKNILDIIMSNDILTETLMTFIINVYDDESNFFGEDIDLIKQVIKIFAYPIQNSDFKNVENKPQFFLNITMKNQFELFQIFNEISSKEQIMEYMKNVNILGANYQI